MRKLTLALMVLVSSMFLPFSAFAQTDMSATSNATTSGFESFSETVTGLQQLPHGIETLTYDKIQDGYTWELDEDGHLYQDWILPASTQGLFLDAEPPETGTFRDHM